MKQTGNVSLQPEYVGESPGHPWPEIDDCGLPFGGDEIACRLARRAYAHVARPSSGIHDDRDTTAELGKYMENASCIKGSVRNSSDPQPKRASSRGVAADVPSIHAWESPHRVALNAVRRKVYPRTADDRCVGSAKRRAATLVEAMPTTKRIRVVNIAVHHIRLQPTTDDRFAQNRPSRGGTA